MAENRCWSCGLAFPSNRVLQSHLHETVDFKNLNHLLDDDRYLKPFLQEDSLLYSFDEDGEGEDDCQVVVDKEELAVELKNLGGMLIDGENFLEEVASAAVSIDGNGLKGVDSASANDLDTAGSAKIAVVGVGDVREQIGLSIGKGDDKKVSSSFKNHAANNVQRVNKSYFGAYSSFGIHREMLGDKVSSLFLYHFMTNVNVRKRKGFLVKCHLMLSFRQIYLHMQVRMDAYSQAILGNKSLFSGAVVMDVGCGTGILRYYLQVQII